ncbi:DUF2140 family protein [Salinicoccus hispanicus]|uniref:DUF2140 family protein n=1 Tax=Salinicoccus hispanicus TaxID=157225 RepID=A0A6N8U2D5_9STAP|nr:DUF2140 family protein [Salinicoccus hispanicus]MXQ50311.1 DUF2140 family protein [Salinicoccus hispanicus]
MNIWKWLFIGLLIVNVGIVIWLFTVLNGNYEAPDSENDNYTPSESGIEIKMNNDAVESVLNESINDDSLTISVDESGIVLDAVQEAYGFTIDTSIALDPVSTGDEVVFEAKNINIADLPLTQDMLYSLIRTQSDLPEGIRFSDTERALVVDSAALTEQIEWDVKVDSIDYGNDEWYFSITR